MQLGRTSCDKVHELQWRHWRISNNHEGTLSAFLTTFIHIYIYIYIYLYIYIICIHVYVECTYT